MLATLGDWSEIPGEPEYDLEPFVVEVGRVPPLWAWNALVRQDLMPVPAVLGEEGWGAEGLKVVKTGQHFPIGSRITKGDLFGRSV